MAVEITCICDLKSEVGEGAFWDEATQALHFVDIPAGILYRLKDGRLAQWAFNEPLGCLALDRSGDPVLALTSGITRVNLATGARQVIAHPEAHLPGNRFNDGVVDRQGRFWLGTMKRQGPPEPTGTFYRLDGDGRVTAFWDGIFTTNGLSFSPDGRTMYLADSNPGVRTIWACDYDPATGTPGERRVFFDTRQVAGRPDGATVDADGCYWMAGVGGWQLYRITPTGVVDRVIDMPCEKPSRPWFGGPKLDILYVTSLAAGLTPGTEARQPNAGGLFAVHGLGVTGLPQPRYAG
ncbi:MAG: SMP-30/gluconolactonase/LRE family protein [Proteobacteria bacterium]|nr:SMP-30/gluconolactonase/LRE family protein [Pseudomonadota bacterium]